jgi:hypothetical protein
MQEIDKLFPTFKLLLLILLSDHGERWSVTFRIQVTHEVVERVVGDASELVADNVDQVMLQFLAPLSAKLAVVQGRLNVGVRADDTQGNIMEDWRSTLLGWNFGSARLSPIGPPPLLLADAERLSAADLAGGRWRGGVDGRGG